MCMKEMAGMSERVIGQKRLFESACCEVTLRLRPAALAVARPKVHANAFLAYLRAAQLRAIIMMKLWHVCCAVAACHARSAHLRLKRWLLDAASKL